MAAAAPPQKELGGTNVGDLVPISAMCCTITSFYCKMPECWGCSSEGTICCIEEEMKCLKCVDSASNEDQKCCILQEAGCYCVKPQTCVQMTQQTFCLDSRCALPCTDKVPCMFNVYGLNCYPAFGCCKSIADLIPEKYGEGAQNAAATNITVVVNTGSPDDTEMKR